jgi:glycosyltransferase involved in cell wall biosynthesis
MIKVGFILPMTSDSWTGGANYYLNLINLLADSRKVEPVVITTPQAPEGLVSRFKGVKIVRTSFVDPGSRLTGVRRVAEKLYGRAFAMERYLRSIGVDLLSHSSHLGPRASLPTIGWIPDFQHRRLPDLFTEKERAVRDRTFSNLASYCTRVVVSSEDALNDLRAFRPAALPRARVLRFASGLVEDAGAQVDEAAVLQKHGINGPYFHLPNQFWAHKNHDIVVEALKVLKSRGHTLTVVATGSTKDYRHPDRFNTFMERLKAEQLQDSFRVLGLVPLEDLSALMRRSVALINPSLFEGWSTTVEESKTLGKTILLSDIPVHREQAPRYGFYFDPKDADALAELMLTVTARHSPEQETQQASQAREDTKARLAEFKAAFEDIVVDAMSGS